MVSGYVVNEGEPVDDVLVRIDDFENLSTTTDETGFFEISGVSQGEKELRIEKTYKLNINKDINLDALRLPAPVLLDVDGTASEISVPLRSSVSDDNDFREYKLYRHNTTGLDESTGTLLHVSTDKTVFYL